MLSRTKLTLLLVAVIAIASAITPVGSFALTTTPPIPNLPSPDPDDTARFKMTISGGQRDSEQFYRAPEADGCSLHMEGSLKEGWAFRRNDSVVMEFRKFGRKIYLQRRNRPFGDSAFRTEGELRRDATGFMMIKTGPNCASFPLPDPTACSKTVKAPLDLRLDYLGGQLTLKGSGPSQAKPNPLEKCGLMPSGGTSFNQLSFPYPFLNKEKGAFSARQIFGKKKRFRIELKAKFLGPLDQTGYTTFSEQFNGSSDLLLVRQ